MLYVKVKGVVNIFITTTSFHFGILGGTTPIACGLALANKLSAEDESIVFIFLGDGALGSGIVYESLNIASLWKLKIFFVIENNQIAQTTEISLNTAGNIEERLNSFGIETNYLRSIDVIEIHNLSKR